MRVLVRESLLLWELSAFRSEDESLSGDIEFLADRKSYEMYAWPEWFRCQLIPT
jgi:hypothetical protein